MPTIDKFLRSLDRDKAERDRRIDEELRARQQAAPGKGAGEAIPHEQTTSHKGGGNEKTVTDPVTGHQVQIADVGPDFLENVKNPKVRMVFRFSEYVMADSASFPFQMRTWARTQ